jgi:F-type H+-transporting ATPase subunit a
MNLRIFGDPILFFLGPVPITETMVTSTAVTLIVIGVACLMRWAIVHGSPRWLAMLAVYFVQTFDDLVHDIIGQPHRSVAVLAGSLFVFIASGNLAGQFPGVHPPTGSLATTSALAAVVFMAVPIAGVRVRGLGEYVRHYFRPNPLLMPLEVISELSRTLALSVRLFGNVMSGHLVVAILVALAGFLVPTPIMALDLLIGLLQAYIFAVLAIVYVGAAMSDGER